MSPIETCTHVRVRHEHGTVGGYSCGCRCDDCRDVRTRNLKGRDHRCYREGDPRPLAIEHVRRLLRYGETEGSIARLTGVDPATVRMATEGRLRTRPAAWLLLACPMPPWTGVGISRRIRGLVALGWTQVAISEQSGIHVARLNRLALTPPSFCFPRVAEAVIAATRALALRVPPDDRRSRYARSVAARNGWHPLLAWDDIDDPEAKPKGVRTRTGSWGGTRASVVELDAAGWTRDAIAARLGIAPGSVTTALIRARRAVA